MLGKCSERIYHMFAVSVSAGPAYADAARVVDMYCTVVALGIDTVYADGACVVDACCVPVVVR